MLCPLSPWVIIRVEGFRVSDPNRSPSAGLLSRCVHRRVLRFGVIVSRSPFTIGPSPQVPLCSCPAVRVAARITLRSSCFSRLRLQPGGQGEWGREAWKGGNPDQVYRRISGSEYRRIAVGYSGPPIGVSAYFPPSHPRSAYFRIGVCPVRAPSTAYRRIGARRLVDTICSHAGGMLLLLRIMGFRTRTRESATRVTRAIEEMCRKGALKARPDQVTSVGPKPVWDSTGQIPAALVVHFRELQLRRPCYSRCGRKAPVPLPLALVACVGKAATGEGEATSLGAQLSNDSKTPLLPSCRGHLDVLDWEQPDVLSLHNFTDQLFNRQFRPWWLGSL